MAPTEKDLEVCCCGVNREAKRSGAMTEVLRSYQTLNFPSSDDLGALDAPVEERERDRMFPEPLMMLMQSMGKLNGTERYGSGSSSAASSPRGSPRASSNNLLSMDTIFETFENKISMNTGVKSQPDLVAFGDSETDDRAIDSANVSILIKFFEAVHKFLDVDESDDPAHMLVC